MSPGLCSPTTPFVAIDLVMTKRLPFLGATCLMSSSPEIPGIDSAYRIVEIRPQFEAIEDVPGLPRVLLIGDSISIGYTFPVRRMLERKANVHRIPENGGPTARGVEAIDAWLGDEPWDVIHFNFGLHDLRIEPNGDRQVSVEDYEANLRFILTRLQKTGARLIWGTTTPVPPGNLSPARRVADVPVYNSIALGVMRSGDVVINDLYRFALPRLDRIQLPENVHFTDEGSELLAEPVAACIEAVLEDR